MQLPSLNVAATIVALQAGLLAANGNGAVLDLKDYKGPISFIRTTSVGTGTTPTVDAKIQTSTDNSTWSNVTNGSFTQVANTNACDVLSFDVKDLSRYVRVPVVVGGTTPNVPATVVAVGQKERI